MSDITRQKTIDYLYYLKTHYPKNLIIPEYIDYAIASLETDEAYQLEYEQPEISKGLFEQIKWERDIAIQQLHELGYEFGQKIETTTKNDFGVDFKLKDYVSREAVRRIIKSPRTQEQMLNALNSLRNVTECKTEDCISREEVYYYISSHINEIITESGTDRNAHTNAILRSLANGVKLMPSVLSDVDDNNVGELTIHCKDCKFFEYDHFEDVFGVPLIVAHEVCTKWGDTCKTNENGACFLAERKESEDKE